MAIGALQVQYAFVSTSAASGAVVPGQTGNNVLILQMCVITSASSEVQFQSSSGPNISALFPLAQNGGFVLPYSRVGWFQTVQAGDGINFAQTSATLIAIQVVYCYI